ncbi:MAG TPA: RluA family pseudouridine synthase [Steroidobacteraceae bacterium]|nr:RluA family pseudouridine synthase [Steroidobacteraceae bacterium]
MRYERRAASRPQASSERESSRVRQVEVTAAQAGQRIDNFLLRQFKSVPRSRVYRLLRRGEVRVNGRRARPDYRLAQGDRLRLPPVRTGAPAVEARVPDALIERLRRAIVHEDADLLVINKPAGLAVHGGSGLSFGVIEALRAARPDESLELVHRLDRETSGCLLVARRRSALRTLHDLLREGAVEKRYLALVAGHWTLGHKRIDVPLKTRQLQGGERVVKPHAAGKSSATDFRPVQFFGKRATLLEATLETGRTHQIRVHAAYAGHPVAGDDKYGDRDCNESLRRLGLDRMFLHAQTVSFVWPATGVEFTASVPLDDELKAVLDRLGG